jgi:hypothetical protein
MSTGEGRYLTTASNAGAYGAHKALKAKKNVSNNEFLYLPGLWFSDIYIIEVLKTEYKCISTLVVNLNRGLVGVPALVLGLDHSVAFEEEVLALVALGLLLEHPLSEGLGLLANLELRGLLSLGISLGLQLLLVSLRGEAFRDIGALVLWSEWTKFRV